MSHFRAKPSVFTKHYLQISVSVHKRDSRSSCLFCKVNIDRYSKCLGFTEYTSTASLPENSKLQAPITLLSASCWFLVQGVQIRIQGPGFSYAWYVRWGSMSLQYILRRSFPYGPYVQRQKISDPLDCYSFGFRV